jgi:hypothetical protein
MNVKKYAIIIDSHPSTDEQKQRLVSNLENLKKQNIDVVLTSRYPCPPEILTKCTHFIYQSHEKFYYLDSDILNYMSCENLEPITPYQSFIQIGELLVIDKLINIQWNISMVSGMQSAFQLLWAKGYNYAFYLIDDFVCPDDLSDKIQKIFYKSSGYKNYFIRNNSNFSSWFAPWFFGVSIDETSINKIPKEDLSDNKVYQKHFPNCAQEDFINRIWATDNNYIDNHSDMDEIFGQENWDIDKISHNIHRLPNSLHVNTTSSIFIKNTESTKHYLLVLSLNSVPYFRKAHFLIEIKNEIGEIIKSLDLELKAGFFYKEPVDWIFEMNKKVFLYKKIVGYGTIESSFEDTIIIDMDKIDCYAKLKYYQ